MKRVLLYAFFGGTAFALDFALLWLLYELLRVSAWLSALLSFTASTLYAFLTQQRVTFKSHGSNVGDILRYAILLGFNALFTTLLVYVFQALWGLYLIGKIVATALTTTWNFFLMKYWVFPTRTPTHSLLDTPAPE